MFEVGLTLFDNWSLLTEWKISPLGHLTLFWSHSTKLTNIKLQSQSPVQRNCKLTLTAAAAVIMNSIVQCCIMTATLLISAEVTSIDDQQCSVGFSFSFNCYCSAAHGYDSVIVWLLGLTQWSCWDNADILRPLPPSITEQKKTTWKI